MSTIDSPDSVEYCTSVSATTWASLVLTCISVQLTWWLFDLPLLWNSGPRVFLESISWACMRQHNPSSAGYIAWLRGYDASKLARMYYMGLKNRDDPPDWTAFKLSKAIIVDLINIAATTSTIYQACTLPETNLKKEIWGISMWMYPNLPVAIVGLCLLLGEWTFPRSKAGSWWLIAFTTLAVVGVGAAISVCLWKFAYIDIDGEPNNFWFLSTMFYAYMALPMIVLGLQGLQAGVIAAWMARISGVGFAALNHNGNGQPYCKIPGPAFAIVYMTLGGIAAFIVVFGVRYHPSHPASTKRRLQQQAA
jgi:hypothetical protein